MQDKIRGGRTIEVGISTRHYGYCSCQDALLNETYLLAHILSLKPPFPILQGIEAVEELWTPLIYPGAKQNNGKYAHAHVKYYKHQLRCMYMCPLVIESTSTLYL